MKFRAARQDRQAGESAVKVSFPRTQQTGLSRFYTETISITINHGALITRQLGLQDCLQTLQHI